MLLGFLYPTFSGSLASTRRISYAAMVLPAYPKPVTAAALPALIGGSRIGQVASSPRPPADATLAAPQASTACHLRLGLHGADLVRASGAGPQRLQSAQTRSSLVSSPV